MISYIRSKITNEGEQAIIRVVFLTFILSYLIIRGADNVGTKACAYYLAYSTVYAMFVFGFNKYNPARQYWGMLVDIGMASYGMAQIGAQGGIFIGLYLWLIIGYGLRYGATYTKVAYVLCIMGFLLATRVNTYWTAHIDIVHGFMLTLLLIPIHTLRLQKKLATETEKAYKSSLAKSEFLSHISHEIRTPLNGVVGTIELLSKTRLNHTQQTHLSHLNNAAIMMRSLVSNILDINKIEQGKFELVQQPVSLKTLVSKTHDLFVDQCKQKKIELISELNTDEDIVVMADELQLRQVLNNLVSNAVKFTEQGSVRLSVNAVSLHEDSYAVHFSVKDTGIGISKDKQTKIFEAFEQADSSIAGKYGGTGLGTTISSKIVRLMNGELKLESDLHKGSDFHFELIMQKGVIPQSTASVLQINKHKSFNRVFNVLIADDNATNRYILKAILESAKFKVYEAENGEKCLDVIDSVKIDLMLLDLNMPDMSGLEVIKAQRQLYYDKHIPSAIVTADATESTKKLCAEFNVHNLLTKPYDANAIIALCQTLLEGTPKQRKTGIVKNVAPIIPVDEPIYNDTQLKMLASISDDPNFVMNLFVNFVGEFLISLKVLETAFSENDISKCYEIAHAMKGGSANLGLVKLYEHCEELEYTIHNSQIAQIQEKINRVKRTFAQTKDHMSEVIKIKYSQEKSA